MMSQSSPSSSPSPTPEPSQHPCLATAFTHSTSSPHPKIISQSFQSSYLHSHLVHTHEHRLRIFFHRHASSSSSIPLSTFISLFIDKAILPSQLPPPFTKALHLILPTNHSQSLQFDTFLKSVAFIAYYITYTTTGTPQTLESDPYHHLLSQIVQALLFEHPTTPSTPSSSSSTPMYYTPMSRVRPRRDPDAQNDDLTTVNMTTGARSVKWYTPYERLTPPDFNDTDNDATPSSNPTGFEHSQQHNPLSTNLATTTHINTVATSTRNLFHTPASKTTPQPSSECSDSTANTPADAPTETPTQHNPANPQNVVFTPSVRAALHDSLARQEEEEEDHQQQQFAGSSTQVDPSTEPCTPLSGEIVVPQSAAGTSDKNAGAATEEKQNDEEQEQSGIEQIANDSNNVHSGLNHTENLNSATGGDNTHIDETDPASPKDTLLTKSTHQVESQLMNEDIPRAENITEQLEMNAPSALDGVSCPEIELELNGPANSVDVAVAEEDVMVQTDLALSSEVNVNADINIEIDKADESVNDDVSCIMVDESQRSVTFATNVSVAPSVEENNTKACVFDDSDVQHAKEEANNQDSPVPGSFINGDDNPTDLSNPKFENNGDDDGKREISNLPIEKSFGVSVNMETQPVTNNADSVTIEKMIGGPEHDIDQDLLKDNEKPDPAFSVVDKEVNNGDSGITVTEPMTNGTENSDLDITTQLSVECADAENECDKPATSDVAAPLADSTVQDFDGQCTVPDDDEIIHTISGAVNDICTPDVLSTPARGSRIDMDVHKPNDDHQHITSPSVSQPHEGVFANTPQSGHASASSKGTPSITRDSDLLLAESLETPALKVESNESELRTPLRDNETMSSSGGTGLATCADSTPAVLMSPPDDFQSPELSEPSAERCAPPYSVRERRILTFFPRDDIGITGTTSTMHVNDVENDSSPSDCSSSYSQDEAVAVAPLNLSDETFLHEIGDEVDDTGLSEDERAEEEAERKAEQEEAEEEEEFDDEIIAIGSSAVGDGERIGGEQHDQDYDTSFFDNSDDILAQGIVGTDEQGRRDSLGFGFGRGLPDLSSSSNMSTRYDSINFEISPGPPLVDYCSVSMSALVDDDRGIDDENNEDDEDATIGDKCVVLSDVMGHLEPGPSHGLLYGRQTSRGWTPVRIRGRNARRFDRVVGAQSDSVCDEVACRANEMRARRLSIVDEGRDEVEVNTVTISGVGSCKQESRATITNTLDANVHISSSGSDQSKKFASLPAVSPSKQTVPCEKTHLPTHKGHDDTMTNGSYDGEDDPDVTADVEKIIAREAVSSSDLTPAGLAMIRKDAWVTALSTEKEGKHESDDELEAEKENDTEANVHTGASNDNVDGNDVDEDSNNESAVLKKESFSVEHEDDGDVVMKGLDSVESEVSSSSVLSDALITKMKSHMSKAMSLGKETEGENEQDEQATTMTTSPDTVEKNKNEDEEEGVGKLMETVRSMVQKNLQVCQELHRELTVQRHTAWEMRPWLRVSIVTGTSVVVGVVTLVSLCVLLMNVELFSVKGSRFPDVWV